MMTRLMIVLATVLLFGGLATSLAPPTETTQTAEAKKDGKEKRKAKKERRQHRNAVRASSYINPDTGLATENPDVDADSECETPDQSDVQQLSNLGQTNNNVHNDACLLKKGESVDTRVSFDISGVGAFSACPDPDGDGPKTGAVMNDGKRCHQSGYQEKGIDGDEEYHARINNDDQPGTSVVTFCVDPNSNGCGDAKTKDRIEILWQS